MEATLTFPCMLCRKLMAIPTEMAGKAVRCPHCKEVCIAPGHHDQPLPPPAFTKPVEQPESIFSEPGANEESVIDDGGQKGLDVSIVQPMKPAAGPPPAYAVPPLPQQTPAVSYPATAYANPAPIPNYTAQGYLMPQQPAFYVPPPAPPPVPVAPQPELVSTESASSRRTKPAAQPLPLKEIIIGCLAMYGLVITVVAIIGWTRSPAPAPVVQPAPAKTKSTRR